MRKVGVESGVNWIGEALRLLRRYPTVFLLMSLIYTGISLVPFGLGFIVILLLGPALKGGMIHAACEAEAGRDVRVGMLFKVFEGGERIGSFIALCLPVLALGVLLFVLYFPVLMPVIQAIMDGRVDPASGNDAATMAALKPIIEPLVGRILLLLLLTLVLSFLGGMLLFLASARIMLAGEGAFAAMRSSFLACARNFGAYFIFMLLIGFGLIVAQTVLSLLLPRVLVLLAISIPLNAMWGPMLYAAHRSMFDDSPGNGPNADAPSPTSPAASSFEA